MRFVDIIEQWKGLVHLFLHHLSLFLPCSYFITWNSRGRVVRLRFPPHRLHFQLLRAFLKSAPHPQDAFLV